MMAQSFFIMADMEAKQTLENQKKTVFSSPSGMMIARNFHWDWLHILLSHFVFILNSKTGSND
jgi:hypothetical protein